jgi:hypothetical protein
MDRLEDHHRPRFVEDMNEIGLEVFDKRDESPVGHPSVAVPADADTGYLMDCPEVGWADRPTSGDVERVSDVQVDVSPRHLLPERLLGREAVAEHEEHPHGAVTDAGEHRLVTTKNEPVGRIFWIADTGW